MVAQDVHGVLPVPARAAVVLEAGLDVNRQRLSVLQTTITNTSDDPFQNNKIMCNSSNESDKWIHLLQLASLWIWLLYCYNIVLRLVDLIWNRSAT